MMDVWVVFQNVNEDPYKSPVATEFQGVFDTREAALAACRTDRYVMGRCRLNDAAPHETSTDWLKDVCYPIKPEPILVEVVPCTGLRGSMEEQRFCEPTGAGSSPAAGSDGGSSDG